MNEFTYANEVFLKDGDPYRIISGSIHYFRSHQDTWADRLQKLKNFGCNTVSTCIPWNLHESKKGSYDFEGILNLERFLKTAAELELLVILRPGPYVCSEIDCGGIPAWVLEESKGQIRCSNYEYITAATAYLQKICSLISPFTYSNGGPVIMVQIENEYGSFGNDKAYLQTLKKTFQENLPPVILFTADQPREELLKAGSIPDTLIATFFGSKPKERFAALEKVQPDKPKFCLEFWSGWHDHWGGNHHVRSAESTAQALDELLSTGESFNIYMFHGGTNFGFTSGAYSTGKSEYQPTVTSYDYDALLNEAGEITQKYTECRKVLEKYVKLPKPEKQLVNEMFEKLNITFPNRATLFKSLQHLCTPVFSVLPVPMEQLGNAHGMVLYRTRVEGPSEDAVLTLKGFNDWAQVFVNEKYHNTLYRADGDTSVVIDIPENGIQLDILVDNLGRICVGPEAGEKKGLTQGVLLNDRYLFNWENYPIDFSKTEQIPFQLDSSYKPEKVPAFYHASFSIERPRDTYIDMSQWGKGICYVNRFNLGRYWNIGPQQTLYLPAPLLRKGKNSLIIFEHYEIDELGVEFRKTPLNGKNSHIKKSLLSRFFSRT